MEENDNIILDALESISKDDFREAYDLLKKAIEHNNDNLECLKNLGLCEINLGYDDEAQETFEKAHQLDPNDATVLYYLACCTSKKDKQKAQELFKKVLDLRKDFLDAYKSLGMLYIETGQYDLAFEYAQNAINNENIENDYSIFYIASTAAMLKKDYDNAINYLNCALELNPSHLSVLNSLATCYMNVGDYIQAEEVLKKAYEIEPNSSLTAYNLGICNQVKGEYKEALKYFQEAYRIEPNTTMLSSLAYCALKSGETMLASSLYQNLVSAYPNNSQYRYSYIEVLEELGDFEKALENIELLLDLDDKNIALIKKKGTCLRKLNRNEESINVFQTLLNRGKIDVEVYYNLAFNYTQMGDFDNAKEMFKKCIILEPANPYAHKDLGVIYLKMNCYDWAVDEMKEAIKLEDDISEFHYSLGVSYMMLSNVQDAKDAFLKAIELDENNADAFAYLGYIYLLDKDYDKASELLQKSLKIDCDNFLAKMYSAKLYFALKKYKTACEFLLDTIEKRPDDENMNMLGVCYMELEEYEKAMGILYNLVHKYPQNHILLVNLAKCEKFCDRKKEALNHIRQALLIYDDDKDALDLLKELGDE